MRTPTPTRRPSPARSTADAPWYVVPADRKWFRNLVISSVLVDTLQDLDLSYPEPADGLDKIEIED